MDKKKIAAATAAVFAYIKTQEEAAYYASQAEKGNVSEATVETMPAEKTGKFSAWANAGRLNHMQQNSMMLMKIK
jgi:hypothetical protein